MTVSVLPPRQRKRKYRALEIDGDIVRITLTRGYVAIADAADFELLDGRNWHALTSPCGMCASTNVTREDGYYDIALMHRALLAAPDEFHVDHINGDRLDNRRSNLRLATNQQNCWNQGLSKRNTSGYKGVSWHSRDLIFGAHIRINGRQKTLGEFADAISAARAYDAAARRHYGEFARLNFPG
jgi:hypothetical protein